MTKRTAMLMAAGVVLALLGGSVALSFGLTGNRTAEAGPRKSEPIVRTIHRTIRVEKQARGSDRSVQVVALQAPASPSDPSSSSDDAWDDDAYEHDDDAYEHDDDSYEHEDDSYEHDDDDSYEDHSWEEGDD